jgi:hypothetical protein
MRRHCRVRTRSKGSLWQEIFPKTHPLTQTIKNSDVKNRISRAVNQFNLKDTRVLREERHPS